MCYIPASNNHGFGGEMPQVVIKDVLAKLVTLGYLQRTSGVVDATATRAITRFQRHAARQYRMPQPDENYGNLFTGPANGIIDAATAAQVDRWIEKGWRLPLGRFQLVTLPQGGMLRADAASAWTTCVGLVSLGGGTLEGPYDDTTRHPRPTTKMGASNYSFHYSGRAVDIKQALAGGPGTPQRYFIEKEVINSNTYWRIHCKTLLQDGLQGSLYEKGQVRCYSFTKWAEYDIPKAYYIDMTSVIESTRQFERIKAQNNWTHNYNKTEWWHFQYCVDKQATFSDELELIGVSESRLRTCGWSTNAQLDRKPG